MASGTVSGPVSGMVAVVVVRDGALPAGADEAVAEAGGEALLAGTGTESAAKDLVACGRARCAEVGPFAPGAWATALAPLVAGCGLVVLPASPDGRDLAPRLAHALGRPLLAGATEIRSDRVVLVRQGGLVSETHCLDGPAVATLVPGVRGVEPQAAGATVEPVEITLPAGAHDAEVLATMPPDPATVDLADARRIVAGGAGLGGPEPFAVLEGVAVALGAAFGATRVASDAGWAPHDRYIGTTGVAVDPDLYVALGISGAVQHVTGLGRPDHVVAVNTDASAPMMAMADLAVVTDARALLAALADRLGVGDAGT
ncbi:MAG TPA: mycofactocin-associated electron transfer flavoprotein alpha subunit [Acidimicrobiales bacterium]